LRPAELEALRESSGAAERVALAPRWRSRARTLDVRAL
jgi:hypothetical protein